MHPVWIQDPSFELKVPFAIGQSVTVTFPEQKPIVDETALVDNAIKKYQGGFISKEQALQEMYPDKSEEEIDDMLEDVMEENGQDVEMPEQPEDQTVEVENYEQ